jgi:hypothetical protein
MPAAARKLAFSLASVSAIARAQPADRKTDAHHPLPGPLGIDETRNASGTSWQPDSTPMFMWHARARGWQLALHTNTFVGYDDTASRGDDALISTNWLMGMATHRVGSGDLTLRAMLSLEPATMPSNGYPLLLQTGETFGGEPIIDRQHPHDLVMELAVRYRQPIGDAFGFELYVAPVGEPAIGPTAFPHRFTAMADPFAPLGHHWYDSTHITFGVATAGVFTKRFKLEGSYFWGREPDENRWDINLWIPDSYSARLSVNPTRDLSAQVSRAHLHSPEWNATDVSIERTTASAIWNHELGTRSDVGVSAVVGQNQPSMGPTTYASLVESTMLLDDTHTVFARVEALTKSGQDLVLPMELENETFGIGALSAGYVYDFKPISPVVTGIGFVGTLDVVGDTLGAVYDTRTPWGAMVFMRLRPPMMKMTANMPAMHHDHSM